MPLSPIPVIVGATIATAAVVIGTGYVFKKLVYDPHISHHVEAFISSHPAFSSPSRPHDHGLVPIPASTSDNQPPPSKGITTGYRDRDETPGTSLGTSMRHRRSGQGSRSGFESGSSHNQRDELDPGYNDRSSAYGHGRDHDGDYELQELSQQQRDRQPSAHDSSDEGGASMYELEESHANLLTGAFQLTPKPSFIARPEDRATYRRMHSDRRAGSISLIDFEDGFGGEAGSGRPDSPQDAEVREIIFRLALTPLRSRSSSPSHPDTGLDGSRFPRSSPAPGNSKRLSDQGDSNPFADPKVVENPFSDPSVPAAYRSQAGGQGEDQDNAQTPTLPVFVDAPGDDRFRPINRPPPPSTTFSFLSISQQSSPEQLQSHLTLSPYLAVREISASSSSMMEERDIRDESGTPTLAGDDPVNEGHDENYDRDDVISIPETSTSSYADAESYTPISRALSPAVPVQAAGASQLPLSSGSQVSPGRPVKLIPADHARIGLPTFGDEDEVQELGMSYVPLPLPAGLSLPHLGGRGPGARPRGPMSVISVGSGSEFGDGESEAEPEAELEGDADGEGEWDLISNTSRAH